MQKNDEEWSEFLEDKNKYFGVEQIPLLNEVIIKFLSNNYRDGIDILEKIKKLFYLLILSLIIFKR